MNTNELMKKYREIMLDSSIRTISLEPSKECSDFWDQLTREMFNNSTLELAGVDYLVKLAMESFAQVDSLEIINKSGRILKRFAKHYKLHTAEIFNSPGKGGFGDDSGAYFTGKMTLSDSHLGIIGDRLQYYVNNMKGSKQFYVDFASKFDWQDGMYGKEDSCYWSCYSASRPTLEAGGCFCLRFYNDLEDENGIGRTWVLPQKGMLVCFNSYGIERADVSKVIKKIFAEHGITLHYVKATLFNSHNSDIPYLNSGTGFFLYPEGFDYTSLLNSDGYYNINLEVTPGPDSDNDTRECEHCGYRRDISDGEYINGDFYCSRCIENLFRYCEKCEEWCDKSDVHRVLNSNRYGYLCDSCATRIGAEECSNCDNRDVESITTHDGDVYCTECKDNHCFYCEECEKWSSGSECDYDSHETEEEQEDESAEEFSFEIERDFISANFERVMVKRYDGHSDNEQNVMTYRDSRVPGLYVYEDSNGWHVQHEYSGMAVTHVDSHIKAFAILERLNGITDWEQDSHMIINNEEIMQRALSIITEYR